VDWNLKDNQGERCVCVCVCELELAKERGV
jgi:hypothetical protein